MRPWDGQYHIYVQHGNNDKLTVYCDVCDRAVSVTFECVYSVTQQISTASLDVAQSCLH